VDLVDVIASGAKQSFSLTIKRLPTAADFVTLFLVAFLLEAGLMFGGMWLYYRATEPVTAGGKYAMPIFGLVMLLLQASTFLGPPPPSPEAAATTALVGYFALAAAVYWLEKKRR
jgi:hypothetical protein